MTKKIFSIIFFVLSVLSLILGLVLGFANVGGPGGVFGGAFLIFFLTPGFLILGIATLLDFVSFIIALFGAVLFLVTFPMKNGLYFSWFGLGLVVIGILYGIFKRIFKK
ncbi:MAG: hypothetical protein WC711_01775 [Candidatus Staskawiczbacteria bacterium]|jgi:hypothetical protein